MNRLIPLAGLMLALTAAKSDPLAGRVAGQPQECVSLMSLDGPAITEDGRLIYSRTGKTLYVTKPIGPCPALRPLSTVIVDVYGSQLCRNDRFRLKAANDIIPSAWCRYDRFVPYTKPGK